MDTSLVNKVRALPPGLLGHVLTYIPRNETAQIMHEAYENGLLTLNYVRFENFMVEPNKDTTSMIVSLAPVSCGSTRYGDCESPMTINRIDISPVQQISLGFQTYRANRLHINNRKK